MGFRDHLRKVMLTFPSLFPNAICVYDHLFLAIGNGYEWKDGELVYDADATLCDSIEEAIAALFCGFVDDIETVSQFDTNDNFRTKFIKRKLTVNKKYIHTILNIDDLLDDLSINDFHNDFYSLSKYSAIANIPEDIHYDWLVAIKDFVEILDKNRDKFKDCDDVFDSIKDRVNTLFISKSESFINSLSLV